MISIAVTLVLLVLLMIKNVLQKKPPSRWVHVAIVVCVVYLFCLRFVGGIYTVPSASMEPNLDIGDYIVGVRVGGLLDNGDIKRGDIAVFKAPSVPRTLYIKRVMGVPGDVVEYHRNKEFTVNGVPVGQVISETEHLLVFRDQRERTGEDYEFVVDKSTPYLKSKDKWIIPDGYYFMVGDNRDHSWDGRYWENPPGTPKHLRGLISKDQIESRYVAKLFNLKLFDMYDPLEAELRIIRNNDN
ncbi:signal peptidase I [Klebsiella pneumoniae]|nr:MULTISPECIES: signal peptidase I [Enterobacteriaceae]HBQ9086433.1 signal peptidase I [Klebsiella quasipneumoniae]EKM7489275.1 signal peptidase I [Klebsiella pneumoniae]TXQ48809.1 signal peptidase I [Escherichia coli]SLP12187.1 Signal peptidase I [Klebsiella pneumoniae]SLP12197.1 Signal peptidase I [Klebsiella pneumoniae]